MLQPQQVQPLNSLHKNTPHSQAELLTEPLLVIACGALAREIQQIKLLNGWQQLRIQCLDAELHNRPERISGQLRSKLAEVRDDYQHIFIAYADCGTGGEIDRVMAEFSTTERPIERLPGAHCYAFFAGLEAFDQLAEEALGTFYLTDFLAQHFDRLIVRGMKLDKHPEIKTMMFGNYTRLVYLSQTHNEKLVITAQQAAQYLGLAFEQRHTGYGLLESGLQAQVINQVINFQPQRV
ncbi:hypothetical protein DKW60_03125 [Leucothrix pacifica]|uniref:DUF1638 domain-containing protein n=2 Tax=Leucothrix pacifica TaxID=1247513 RepID=A0A317CND9_9GAMM|nr:hypothetical protein DKW60_03125 [Leucothrix pacifica]